VIQPELLNASSRKEHYDAFIYEMNKLRRSGIEVHYIHILLEALASEMVGYKYFSSINHQYDKAIEALDTFKKLSGINYCIEVLSRHRSIYTNRLKTWKNPISKKPSIASSRHLRCSLAHVFVIWRKHNMNNRLFRTRGECLEEACNLISLIGFRSISSDQFRKEYSSWHKDLLLKQKDSRYLTVSHPPFVIQKLDK